MEKSIKPARKVLAWSGVIYLCLIVVVSEAKPSVQLTDKLANNQFRALN